MQDQGNIAARVGMLERRAPQGGHPRLVRLRARGLRRRQRLGRRSSIRRKAGSGESGRATEIIGQNWRRRTQAVRVGPRLEQVTVESSHRPEVPGGGRRRDQAAERHAARGRRQVAYAPGNGPTGSPRTATRRCVEFDIKGDREGRAGDDSGLDPRSPRCQKSPIQKCGSSSSADASAEKELDGRFRTDLQKAEKLSLPVTLLILLIAFGALVAAGLPVAAGALRRDGDDRASSRCRATSSRSATRRRR